MQVKPKAASHGSMLMKCVNTVLHVLTKPRPSLYYKKIIIKQFWYQMVMYYNTFPNPRSPLTWLVETWMATAEENALMTGWEMKLSRNPKGVVNCKIWTAI